MGKGTKTRAQVNILGVQIDAVTMKEAINCIENMLTDGKKHQIVTPNPEHIILAQKDKEFKEILNQADLATPDGAGIIWASKILHRVEPFFKPVLKERVTGTDLMVELCRKGAQKNWSVYFLGGEEHIPSQTAINMKSKYSKLSITGASNQDPHLTTGKYRIPPTDILFVAYGAPTQEKWISEHLGQLPIKIAIGIGGAFDFVVGKQKRAPKLFQNLGIEWLWRLITQPWRWRRQIALINFVRLVLKEKKQKK
ncbi:WecB/TagA/CpsF family glycosyltransferase [Patescibacteria group bacterium]|nr:WecB/TagA/CpsF family glycosyltransferase [Patescibacteria group bacterium]